MRVIRHPLGLHALSGEPPPGGGAHKPAGRAKRHPRPPYGRGGQRRTRKRPQCRPQVLPGLGRERHAFASEDGGHPLGRQVRSVVF
jgi:hypothetical protein